MPFNRSLRSSQMSAPDDDYERVLSEGGEDIDDDSVFLMKELGLITPLNPESMQADTKIQTLRHMVCWLDKVRQNQATGADDSIDDQRL